VLEAPPGAACRHPARSDRTASRRRVRGSRVRRRRTVYNAASARVVPVAPAWRSRKVSGLATRVGRAAMPAFLRYGLQ